MKRYYPSLVLVLTTAVLAGVAAGQQTAPPAAKAKSSTTTAAPGNSVNDPLFDVPPLPTGKVSLVGGTVTKIDRVRNHLTVRVFGGGNMDMTFDERSHIYRDGVETTQLGVRKGDRVYVDTMLDGSKLFARNIRVENTVGPADARGQIMDYDARTGTMRVRDELSAQEVMLSVDSSTGIRRADQPGSRADLKPGSLVSVRFAPDRANRGVAQEISIIAAPGSSFVFAGRVTYLDLHLGTFAVENRTDQKTYELHFAPTNMAAVNKLVVGADVTVTAVFDGAQYTASDIAVRQ